MKTEFEFWGKSLMYNLKEYTSAVT